MAGLVLGLQCAVSIAAEMPATAIAGGGFSALRQDLLAREPHVDRFSERGPFAVTQKTIELRPAPSERVSADAYLPSAPGRSPLVIFLHGHDSSSKAHAGQAAHVASWGMHALSVQLHPEGPWDANGRTLARLVRVLAASPHILDRRVDPRAIVLVGHSFGAYAVTVALAAGAPVTGAILLDPAAPGSDLREVLRRVRKPVLVIGADERIAVPRQREYFFEWIAGAVAEVSIRGAVHEDAQYPSETAVKTGVDPDVTEALQIAFAGALTAGAFSVAATGSFDYAWRSLRTALDEGRLFHPKVK